jgi:hypothetical protein
MLRTTYELAARSLAVAGILSVVAVAAPAIAHAQTGDGERALLNHIENPAAATMALSVRPTVDEPVVQGPTGQRALTGRGPAAAFAYGTFDAIIARPSPGRGSLGTRALMGRE